MGCRLCLFIIPKSLPKNPLRASSQKSSIPYFRRTFNLPFCPWAVDKLAPHPLPFICITKEVYCTVEADLFHKLLCVNPQKKGFEICAHEALGLAFLPQPALSLHNHGTLTAPMEPVMEQTSQQGPHVEGAYCAGEEDPHTQHQGSLELFLYPFQGHAWAVNNKEWVMVGWEGAECK